MEQKKIDKLVTEAAEEITRHSVPVVYTAIKFEGEDELSRPAQSLWWSGMAAGIAIFLSVIGSGALAAQVGIEQKAIVCIGYTLGFLVVVLGRLQLFTENTITAVIPLLHQKNSKTFNSLMRLWSIVFVANMIGVFIAAFATIHLQIFPDNVMEGIIDVSYDYVDRNGLQFFTQGVPAGFLVAALVWMLPSARESAFFLITSITYFIALTGSTHVIAGSGEVFIVMLLGDISLLDAVADTILPTLAGNVLGGTALFTLLAYSQVRKEL